jgi:hypothetical protein
LKAKGKGGGEKASKTPQLKSTTKMPSANGKASAAHITMRRGGGLRAKTPRVPEARPVEAKRREMLSGPASGKSPSNASQRPLPSGTGKAARPGSKVVAHKPAPKKETGVSPAALTPERLRELLDYDPATSVFRAA